MKGLNYLKRIEDILEYFNKRGERYEFSKNEIDSKTYKEGLLLESLDLQEFLIIYRFFSLFITSVFF
ncbi:MAG: hypothetical protein COA82_04320 [Alkaliphilus sp.]|nr:hypothetical protein [bacterium AH-315-G05]MBN4074512.1 hypothetical protein [bacterium AH-315-E09]PHS35473.1 MAG: hypothetical protein COA82_04320 [Alkaliphilus sp.]